MINIGEECHTVGEKLGAARHIEGFPNPDAYANLVLLCCNHHKVVDDDENIFTIDTPCTMKCEHERAIQRAHEQPAIAGAPLPRLALLLFELDDPSRATQNDLSFACPPGPIIQRNAFGIRLENTEPSTVAERSAITITAWWGGGEELEYAPRFTVPRQSKWQAQRDELVCSSSAVLVFQDSALMCLFEQAVTWEGFECHLHGPWTAHIDFHYDIRSVRPYTETKGVLRITALESSSGPLWW